MNPAVLSVVLFDLDGTLIERPAHARRGRPAVSALNHGVREAVEAIAQRFRIGIISDGGGLRQRAKLHATGLDTLMSTVVISGEVRAQKPSAAIFARALGALGCSGAAALFVGDDLRRDVAGARNAGLYACWVSRGRPLPAGAIRPDIIVDDVAELCEALSC